MRHWRWYSKVLFALLVAAFVCFVWPTPYVWYPVERSRYMVRRDRLTGRCTWVEAKEPRRKAARPTAAKAVPVGATFGGVYGSGGSGTTWGEAARSGRSGRTVDELYGKKAGE